MHNTIFSIPTCCKSYHCSWAAPGLLAPELLLAAPGCSWLLLGCSWLLLGCSWLLLAAPELLLGCFWLLLAPKKANYARHSLLLSPWGRQRRYSSRVGTSHKKKCETFFIFKPRSQKTRGKVIAILRFFWSPSGPAF